MQRYETKQNAGAGEVLNTVGVALLLAGGSLCLLILFFLPMACSAVVGLDLMISGFLLFVGLLSLLLGKAIKNRNLGA